MHAIFCIIWIYISAELWPAVCTVRGQTISSFDRMRMWHRWSHGVLRVQSTMQTYTNYTRILHIKKFVVNFELFLEILTWNPKEGNFDPLVTLVASCSCPNEVASYTQPPHRSGPFQVLRIQHGIRPILFSELLIHYNLNPTIFQPRRRTWVAFSELSTGHFSRTRPDPTRRNVDLTRPDPRLPTKSLTRPDPTRSAARPFPHVCIL